MRAFLERIQIMHEFLKGDRVRVIARTNANETRILGVDSVHSALRIAVAAPAVENKANVALIKFLSRETGKRAMLVSGKSSKLKMFKFS